MGRQFGTVIMKTVFRVRLLTAKLFCQLTFGGLETVTYLFSASVSSLVKAG